MLELAPDALRLVSEQSPEQIQHYLRQARALNTRRAYHADWGDFTDWCRQQQLSALPAEPSTVAFYLTALSNRAKVPTLTRRLSTISQMHRLAGQPSPSTAPVVRELMAGIRRVRGTAPAAKRPVLVNDLRAMWMLPPETPLGIRDRALVLLGFSGAFRRSELVQLDSEDLRADPSGLIVTLRHSKTDKEGQGRTIGIPYGTAQETCPVMAVRSWMETAGIQQGALFRRVNRHGHVLEQRLSAAAVGLVVKRWVLQLGYDPAEYGGHSLRAGLATAAAMAGKDERVIMQQTGHRSLNTLRRYIRDGNLFRQNAAEGIGL